MIDWQKTKRLLATTVICGAALTGLQGCVEMVVGAAVVGTFSATDRRTVGAQTEDKGIIVKGETRAASVVGDYGHVNVTSFNRKVLLTGEVRDAQMRSAVEREIAGIEGVQSVVNELEVGPISSFSSRSSDSYITSKVLASFIDAKDIYSNAFKVVTERGTVYLMGRVTQREGARAAEIASGVSGVFKVVKLFDYISEDDLRQMSSKPTNAPVTEPAAPAPANNNSDSGVTVNAVTR
ncbi:MAG: BON domain-containing protein [Burkholderiaceae bacterium]|nr:BON domain-containing protein [Burkholderiaceae bacterium]